MSELIEREAAWRVIGELQRTLRAQGEGYTEPYARMGYCNMSIGAEKALEALRALPASTRYAELERAARAIDDYEDDSANEPFCAIPVRLLEALGAALDALGGGRR